MHKRNFRTAMVLMVVLSMILSTVFGAGTIVELNSRGQHWALATATKFNNLGLLDGIQDPIELDRAITRAELVTLMNNAMGYPMEMKGGFADVYGGHPYYYEIAAAKAAGYINGYENGSFKPEGQISRQELAVILSNVLMLEAKATDTLDRFSDQALIPNWSREAIGAVVDKGIMNGYPDQTCRVTNPVTMAESMIMIRNAIGTLLNEGNVYGMDELGEVVAGNLTINTSDVILKDVTIQGNLVLAPGIGDGDVLLEDVTVLGETLVAGGGENSVVFRNTTLTTVIIYKKNGKVRVVAEGTTQIDNAKVKGQAKLVGKTDEDKGFGEVEIHVLEPGQSVELEGDFKNINVESEVKLEITGNTLVRDLVVSEAAKNSEIVLNEGTRIEKADVPGDTVISGDGEVDKKIIDGKPSDEPEKDKDKENKKKKKDDDTNDSSDDLVRGDSLLAVQEIALEESGSGGINENQLGFYPPSMWESEPEAFQGWIMMYSQSPIDTVWDLVSGLGNTDIEAYSENSAEGLNKMYRITNYSWADGLGNTFRAEQKDVVSGEGFGTGQFYFYVGTYTVDGLVALARLDEVLDVKPVPQNVTWSGSGATIENYAVDFESENDSRIIGNLIFYSTEDLYTLTEAGYAGSGQSDLRLMDLSKEQIMQMCNEGKGKFVEDLFGPIAFDTEQRDIYSGEVFGAGVYNVGVASISEQGVLGLAIVNRMVITADVPAPATNPIDDGIGMVLPAGGGTSSTDPDAEAFYAYIRNAAGGGTPRIAILSSSRDTLSVVENHYYYKHPTYGSLEDNFEALGFEPVYIPLAVNTEEDPDGSYVNYVAESDYWAGVIKTCDAVFLQGGDQAKHAKALLRGDGSDTKLLEAMRYVYDRGGVIAGTSAGMHIMSDPVFGYGNPDVVLKTNETEAFTIEAIPAMNDVTTTVENNNLMHPGAGFMPGGVINDTHFDARGRLGRLVVAMRDTGSNIGVGADEGTALAITEVGGEMVGEVVGNHGIYIVDSDGADYSDSGSDTTFEVNDLVVHYLTQGDTYNFDTKEILIAGSKEVLVEDAEAQLYKPDGLFDGDYETTKAMIALVESDATSGVYDVTTQGAPNFTVTFTKSDDTEAYQSEEGYVDESLADYNQTSIKHLIMKVEEKVDVEGEAPSVSSFEMDSSYKVFIKLAACPDGIDESTINQGTITVIGNTIDPGSPVYYSDTHDIKVSVAEPNDYVDGDKIKLDGIKDNAGRQMQTQVWVFDEDSNAWQRERPTITGIDIASSYKVFLQFAESTLGIDGDTVNQTTVQVLGNTIDPASPVYYIDTNDMKVSVADPNDYVDGDKIQLDGITDSAGYAIQPQVWVYDGDADNWFLEKVDVKEIEIDSSYKVFIKLVDTTFDIDEETINQTTIEVINNTIDPGSPVYYSDTHDIKVSVADPNDYVSGDQIVISGIKDVKGNTIEDQTWEFDGTDWIRQ